MKKQLLTVFLTILMFSSLSIFGMRPVPRRKRQAFNVGIFIEKTDRDGLSFEERRFIKKTKREGITESVFRYIENGIPAIVSAGIMRNFLRVSLLFDEKKLKGLDAVGKKYYDAGSKLKDKHPSKKHYEIRKRLFSDEWVILLKDSDFVALIPKEIYDDLGKRVLNWGLLPTIRGITPRDGNPEHVLFDRLKKPESKGFDFVKSLGDMFSRSGVAINKRAFLVGHGRKAEKILDSKIVNLSIPEYRLLRDFLEYFGFSFVFIRSCFGGSVGYLAQTRNFKLESTSTLEELYDDDGKKEELSSKGFIEVIQGMPGEKVQQQRALQEKRRDSDFFNEIDRFFEYLAGVLKEQKKRKYATEREMLQALKLDERLRKEVESSENFKNIFRAFLKGLSKENIPSCRFPGDREMSPILVIGEKDRGEEEEDGEEIISRRKKMIGEREKEQRMSLQQEKIKKREKKRRVILKNMLQEREILRNILVKMPKVSDIGKLENFKKTISRLRMLNKDSKYREIICNLEREIQKKIELLSEK